MPACTVGESIIYNSSGVPVCTTPAITGEPIFVKTYSWDYNSYDSGVNPAASNDAADNYNGWLNWGITHWPPLAGDLAGQTAVLQSCAIYHNPDGTLATLPAGWTQFGAGISPGALTNCGDMICYAMTVINGVNIGPSFNQLTGYCEYVPGGNCGGVTRNGFGIGWNCMYKN
jgi:hypothetical protein